jgi:DUF4097 and DUF4098 domain-containing protein YvlB
MTWQPLSIPSSLFLALPLAIGALAAGCVNISAGSRWVVEREEKRFTFEGKPDVKLRTGDGSIDIRSWDGSDVLVVVEKRGLSREAAAGISVTSHQDANHISIDVKMRGGEAFGWFVGDFRNAKLIVSVPAAADVDASTGDGSIFLEGVHGAISLKSGDGSIRARDAAGSISARSGDGSIRLDHVTGTVDANTSDGSIAVAGVLSAVRARSGDGGIGVHAQPGSKTDADWEIWSGDGGVRVDVPEDFGAELDAHTGDGRVHFDGITLSNVTGEFRRNHTSGRLGAGGHALRLRTGDGSILVRRISAQ